MAHDEREEEDDDKVNDQGRSNPDDGDNLVHYLMALRSEENKDGVQQADQ